MLYLSKVIDGPWQDSKPVHRKFPPHQFFWSWSLHKSDIIHIKWFNGWRKIVFGILWIKTLVWPNWGRQDPHMMALLNSGCLVKCFLCPAAKMITCCNGYRASQLSNHCWQPYPLDVLTYETQVSETSPGAAYCWIGHILPPGVAWAEIGYKSGNWYYSSYLDYTT